MKHLATLLIAFAVCAAVLLAWGAAGQCVENEIQKILASDGAAGDDFGFSVAVDGPVAIVGARNDDGGTGAAYIFEDDGGSWVEVAKLIADDATPGDTFGVAVDISGDTAVIGARFDSDNGTDSGAAYVFRDVGGGNWMQIAKLLASDGAAFDEFGWTVAIDGDVVVVGSRWHDAAAGNAGAAYVFGHDGNDLWFEVAKLMAADAAADDEFGAWVDVCGQTIAVASRYDDDNGIDSGSAYIFRDDGNAWTENAKLLPATGAVGDTITSVAIEGDLVVLGSQFDDDNGENAGAAYVFRNDGSDNWFEEAALLASDGASLDRFGVRVAVHDGVIAVGAYHESALGDQAGAAYFFRRLGDVWVEITKLLASDGAAQDELGITVALGDGIAWVGAHRDDDTGADSGSAYIFDISPRTLHVPDDFGTIQAAINAACPGDTVLVAPGTYNESTRFWGKPLTLESSDGPAVTTIRGTAGTSAVKFEDAEPLGTTVRGFTLTHDSDQAGVLVRGSPNGTSHAIIENCWFLDRNVPTQKGLGITIQGLSAPADVLVRDCIFSSLIGRNGSAVFVERSATLTAIDCDFFNNSAQHGGAADMVAGENGVQTIHFHGCRFVENQATSGNADGGAIDCFASPDSGAVNIHFTNCEFIGNTAADRGGAIFNQLRPGHLHLTNCTLHRNAAFEGEALYLRFGTTSVHNAIFRNNGTTAPIFVRQDKGASIAVTYSNIEGGFAGIGNTDADPLFVDPDGADDILGNEDDDLRLSAHSPCIDAADNDALPADEFDLDNDGDTAEPLPVDLDFLTRQLDDCGVVDTGNGSAPIVDMGAHEFQEQSPVTALLVDAMPRSGAIIDGDVTDLFASDDLYLHTRSGFGSSISDLHRLELIISAVTECLDAAFIDIAVESRIDEVSGSARIFLRNWNTGDFEQVRSYTIGLSEETEIVQDIAASDHDHDYIGPNGEIDLLLKHNVFRPFVAFQFDSFFDFVQIVVR